MFYRILVLLSVLLTSTSFAAKQTLQTVGETTHGDVRTTVNDNATKSNSNFTELYTGKVDGTIKVYAQDAAPATCVVGDIWIDTNGTTGQRLYSCETTNTWALQGGVGYNNLTSFVEQSAWKLFYSNGSGDITELALGTDGTFLKGNGTTAAPTWSNPLDDWQWIGLTVTAPLSLNNTTGVLSFDTSAYALNAHTHTGDYEPADSSIVKTAEIDSLAKFQALVGWNIPSSVTVQASDPTSASPVGWYCATNSGDCFYKTSAGLFTLPGSYAADPTAPTISSMTIGTNGTTLTLVASESVKFGAGGNGGLDVDCSVTGSNIAATYSSGAPGTSLVYTLASTVTQGETCNFDYTQPGNGLEANDDSIDLVTVTDGVVTNNSTVSASTWTIDDAFGSDTSANYTNIRNSVTYDATEHNMKGGTSWGWNYAYHETTLGSANQIVEANVTRSTTSSESGMVLARVDTGASPITGYMAQISSTGKAQLSKFSGTSITGVQTAATGSANTSGPYKLKMTTSGTTIKVFVDDVETISLTDSSYSSGNYCGIGNNRNLANTDVRVDDFKAKAN